MTAWPDIARGFRSVLASVTWVACGLAPPLLRIALAIPFFRSGLTKWSGFLVLNPAAEFLFEDEFKLHLFGKVYDYPAPALLAYFDSVAEIVLPVLLIVGLGTRVSSLGILIMVGVIQLTVPDGWANYHLPWAALAVSILALGPGKLSLDHLVGRFFAARPGAELKGARQH